MWFDVLGMVCFCFVLFVVSVGRSLVELFVVWFLELSEGVFIYLRFLIDVGRSFS